ncbi:MAG: hypothetical protein Q7S44_01940 [bacterium]|nr:hypothetical protein [bacterium]
MAQETILEQLEGQLSEKRADIDVWKVDNLFLSPRSPQRFRLDQIKVQQVDFIIAPKTPLPLEIEPLNEFLQGLTTLKPSQLKRFAWENDRRGEQLNLGWMSFEEIVGQETIRTSAQIETEEPNIFEKILLPLEDTPVAPQSLCYTRNLKLRPYPNARAASWAATFEQAESEGKIIATGYRYRWLQNFLIPTWIRQLRGGKNPFTPSNFRGEAREITPIPSETLLEISKATDYHIFELLYTLEDTDPGQKIWIERHLNASTHSYF